MNETSSELPRRSSAILSYLQKSSAIFGTETFVGPSDNVWRIYGNLRKMVGNLLKIAIDVVFSMLFSCSILYPTREISSCIEDSKRNSISMGTMYYSFCIDCYAVHCVYCI